MNLRFRSCSNSAPGLDPSGGTTPLNALQLLSHLFVSGSRLDQRHQVANRLHPTDFRSREFDFEGPLNREHQLNVGQAIPPIHVFGGQSRSRGDEIIIKEICHDFR
jgi:hypothetical protein